MQIEALKIYCDIVRLHSFSRAAEANDLPQSSASQTVRNLEDDLGVTLIDRSCRPWEITEEGKLFYEGAREVVERFREAVSRVKRSRASGNSVIRIAAIYSVNFREMKQYVQAFNRAHPEVHVEVEYAHPDEVCEHVLNEEADLGIISYPEERRGLAIIPWREQQMVLACHPQHRLAKLKSVEVKQLRDEVFVGFDADLVIWKKTDRFLKDHDVEPDVAVRFDNIEATKRAVEAGSGVAILPRPTFEHELRLGTLAAVPLAHSDFMRPLGLLHRKGRTLYSSLEAFIAVLKEGPRTAGGSEAFQPANGTPAHSPNGHGATPKSAKRKTAKY